MAALPEEEFIKDTICEGETYTKHDFNLPPQRAGEHLYYHTYITLDQPDCPSLIRELALNVVPRYTYIRKTICVGQNYSDTNGFHVIQPMLGLYRDTVWTARMEKLNFT